MSKYSAKVTITTLGCDKNKVDSETVLNSVKKAGFSLCDGIDEAQIIIVNTCGFIKSAIEESLDTFFQIYHQTRKQKPLLVLTGCLVGRFNNDLNSESLQEADLIVPGQQIANIGQLILDYIQTDQSRSDLLQNALIETNIDIDPNNNIWQKFNEATMINSGYGYVKIADGCDHGCRFCTIPAIKGKMTSIAVTDICQKISQQISLGIKEIILVAQDTVRYGQDLPQSPSLLDLLTTIEEKSLDGLEWLRLLYLHPDFVTKTLIQKIASSKKMVNYLDIPMQHSSLSVLKNMGRPSKPNKYDELIDSIRSTNQEFAIRSSFIIGYPGESKKDHEHLADFLCRNKLDRVGFFLYSDEEDTPAHLLKYKIKKSIAQKRLQELLDLQKNISQKKLAEKVGRTIMVLIEGKENGEYFGRSQWDAPEVDGQVFISSQKILPIGQIIPVEIVASLDHDLLGEI